MVVRPKDAHGGATAGDAELFSCMSKMSFYGSLGESKVTSNLISLKVF
jgi:hypothetical protein